MGNKGEKSKTNLLLSFKEPSQQPVYPSDKTRSHLTNLDSRTRKARTQLRERQVVSALTQYTVLRWISR